MKAVVYTGNDTVFAGVDLVAPEAGVLPGRLSIDPTSP